MLPKVHRFSIGERVDGLFVETIELIVVANFSQRDKKLPFVDRALQKIDTIKIFLLILWETKSLDNKKYIAVSLKIDEVGKMLGGWKGKLIKETPPMAEK